MITGSVRVDLLGGTLDLNPINMILKNVVTLNVATSLKAKVIIEEFDQPGVKIFSKDYKSESFFEDKDFTEEKLRGDFFGPLSFVGQILKHLGLTSHVSLSLESGSPPGAGLGGSSAMGVTLYKAILNHQGKSFDRLKAIKEVNGIEARILNAGPAGYQDYYPALYGGILALVPKVGEVEVKQLFTSELKAALEKRITLVYSGQTRMSGINNWEVYKQFFDKNEKTIKGLETIADLSSRAFSAIKENDYSLLIDLIGREGESRRELFPNIQTPEMDALSSDLKKACPSVRLKICGAGGGGCFLICHEEKDKEAVKSAVTKHDMTELPFSIEEPI